MYNHVYLAASASFTLPWSNDVYHFLVLKMQFMSGSKYFCSWMSFLMLKLINSTVTMGAYTRGTI